MTDEHIDLLIGGSPCQDLSIAKKNRQGLEGNRSSLFWEYVRILNEINPTYFILENVASMPQKDKDIITETLGVQPVMFNASLVSAQSRKRLFWTNIQFELPEDRNIVLKDILQPNVDDCFTIKTPHTFHQTAQTNQVLNKRQQANLRDVNEKAHCLTSTNYKGSQANGTTLIKLGHLGNTNSQGNRVYDPEGKAVTLSANGGGLGAKTGLYRIGRDTPRRLDANGQRNDGNTTLPVQRRIELRTDDKCGTLTSVPNNLVVSTQSVRKLTPVECERLQGLPDNYTECIAMTNRYKCLGNAFNVDVIAHILNHIPK
jgi:DNA (cytosine-5)-methyltransferase 3A